MKIKKFIAKDFKDAIRLAKVEMGQDAIILQTKQIKTGGFLGLFAKPQVEVTVAIDDSLQVNLDKMRQVATPNPSSGIEEVIKTKINESKVNSSPKNNEDNLLNELNVLKNMMSDIKLQMYEVELTKGISDELKRFYDILVKNNVDKDIALQIVTSTQNQIENNTDRGYRTEELLLNTLQKFIDEIKPIEIKSNKKGSVIFFVGPTGVGKTTTIAKLAANIAFVDNKDVALITLDTFRISAAEQLRTFAEIINIPISVVFEPDDLLKTILEYNDKDVILVDTAGRSPYNDEHLAELKQFIDACNPDETILVLSAITDSNDLYNIYQKFNLFNIDKIIFTKLDETNNYGQLLNVIYEIKKPIAYLTNGQNVPDDIEIPDKLHFAKMLLKEGETI
ncbi:MAG: flagellar biosynthesis protein FlhF [Syntrophomonadaceae bacterium]|nr:flagellar biosynthesis protein FlhF [Syntrophomonadaceae bacterium]